MVAGWCLVSKYQSAVVCRWLLYAGLLNRCKLTTPSHIQIIYKRIQMIVVFRWWFIFVIGFFVFVFFLVKYISWVANFNCKHLQTNKANVCLSIHILCWPSQALGGSSFGSVSNCSYRFSFSCKFFLLFSLVHLAKWKPTKTKIC